MMREQEKISSGSAMSKAAASLAKALENIPPQYGTLRQETSELVINVGQLSPYLDKFETAFWDLESRVKPNMAKQLGFDAFTKKVLHAVLQDALTSSQDLANNIQAQVDNGRKTGNPEPEISALSLAYQHICDAQRVLLSLAEARECRI